MGGVVSHLLPCLNPENARNFNAPPEEDGIVYSTEEQLDETLGHSFCYVRSSGRFLSPNTSDRFEDSFRSDSRSEPGFRAISGAAVSANTLTPRTVFDEGDGDNKLVAVNGFGFDCSESFSALPLQPVPRGDRGTGCFLSGPIERAGAMSGPLDCNSNTVSDAACVPFSAPLSVGNGVGGDSNNISGSSRGNYKKRRKKSLVGIKNSLYRSFSEKKRPWVVPVGRKEGKEGEEVVKKESGIDGSNVQWALGKAGEDRVHVVVSEEHGWVFVGIYDGFNGPDAPEFLMGHLYRAVFHEVKGLFWDNVDDTDANNNNNNNTSVVGNDRCNCNLNVQEHNDNGNCNLVVEEHESEIVSAVEVEGEANRGVGVVKRVTFLQEGEKREASRRRLWEFLAEDDAEDGLDLSGSDRFAFSVDDAIRACNVGSGASRRSLMLSKLKHGWSRSKDGHNKGGLFHWRFGIGEKEKVDVENRVEDEETRVCKNGRTRKTGPVDHELVLKALAHALDKTEHAYLDLTDRVLDQYPELALMGSCLLVVLMRDEDVYVMNLGDSRAIVAQLEPKEKMESGSSTEGVAVEYTAMKLTALQLSTDHSTSIEEEVKRIKREHPDDNHCIVNDRVKGRLKVTRAFGAGSLKQAKFNDSLLEMFRNEFIGAAPYVSCIPSLRHHHLGPKDQFLVLSSDGLNQYLTNQEVVSFVENFLEKYPDGDPAQHLIEELLNRAAKKAGMDFHDLLDIPQGDRRKYHDDVTVMVISLEGRIWKSSGKYP